MKAGVGFVSIVKIIGSYVETKISRHCDQSRSRSKPPLSSPKISIATDV